MYTKHGKRKKIASKGINKDCLNLLLIDLIINKKIREHDKEVLRRTYITLFELGIRLNEIFVFDFRFLRRLLTHGIARFKQDKTGDIRAVRLTPAYREFILQLTELEMEDNETLLIHKRNKKFSKYGNKSFINKVNRHIVSVLGIEYSSHGFRRNLITQLYTLAGNNIKIPQKVVGHKNVNSTAIYVEVNEREIEEVLSKGLK